jgi:hypothetical protein
LISITYKKPNQNQVWFSTQNRTKIKIYLFEERDLEPDFPFMCGTRTETKTILIHFVVPKTKVLHQNKELLNTGFFVDMPGPNKSCMLKFLLGTNELSFTHSNFQAYCLPSSYLGATVNQDPPAHPPMDACYNSVVDEPQLS